MRRVVILGGYGAVGREVVAGLRGHVPEIVVAGRDLAKARTVDGAIPMRLDLRGDDPGGIDADAVVMCAETGNVRVAGRAWRGASTTSTSPPRTRYSRGSRSWTASRPSGTPRRC